MFLKIFEELFLIIILIILAFFSLNRAPYMYALPLGYKELELYLGELGNF